MKKKLCKIISKITFGKVCLGYCNYETEKD